MTQLLIAQCLWWDKTTVGIIMDLHFKLCSTISCPLCALTGTSLGFPGLTKHGCFLPDSTTLVHGLCRDCVISFGTVFGSHVFQIQVFK